MPLIMTTGQNMARMLCGWRRPVLRFNTCLSLARHQHDSARPPLDPRLKAGLGKKILEKSSEDLEASSAPVSLDSGFRVVNTFNAIRGAASPISVPGSPPSWKDPELPVCLPEGAMGPHQPRIRPSDMLSMLELSESIKPSDFRYDEVDIVTHAAILVLLHKLCAGKAVGARRISLRMTQGTLLIADDPLMTVRDSSHVALRSAVVEHCAETAPGLQHSIHYRSVQYSLGHVSCVVQDEVDASCSIPPGGLRLSPSPNTVESVVSRRSHLPGEPAFIRIRSNRGWLKGRLQSTFWFSRTPVDLELIIDREGTITKVSKVDAMATARVWEEQDMVQDALRKLPTLLCELKEAVKAAAPDGQECIGIVNRHLDRPTIRLFLSEDESKMAPKDIGDRPKLGDTSHGQDEASNGERQGPTSPA